jgi:hypothetical protein
MPKLAQAIPAGNKSSFASFLASFTGRMQDDEWDDSALAQDVATISYEQALGAARREGSPHARADSVLEQEASLVSTADSGRSAGIRANPSRKPKSASITLRVTAEEQLLLHERSEAAHLSVSAYLRSCIFEAEALRSQVKDALAEMQSASSQRQSSPESGERLRGSPINLARRWWRLHRTKT